MNKNTQQKQEEKKVALPENFKPKPASRQIMKLKKAPQDATRKR
jgi:hypothetical protein